MAHSRKIGFVSLALLIILTTGCAGSGLRNMFSRNETEGYKTLEELEAEEADAAERDTAVADADSQGPRFAPWLPFGKKPVEETDVIAANDAASPDSQAETASSGWWKNPFRKRDAVELDPFLTQDDTESVATAKSEKTDESRTLSVATDRETESTLADESVKTVSGRRETSVVQSEDEMLVEKFEKHFQQNTVETAEAAERAEPLIVAGKSTAKNSKVVEPNAEEKLLELERLLAERRSSPRNPAPKEATFADESADLNQTFGETFGTSKKPESAAAQNAGDTPKRGSQAVDSFDRLLAGTPSPVVSPKNPLIPDSQNRLKSAGTQASADVKVAAADWLFGDGSKDSSANDTRTNSPGTASGGWSGTSNSSGDQWLQTENKRSANDLARHGQVLKSATGQPVGEFAAVRVGDKIPAAALRDTPDTGFPFSERSFSQTAGNVTTREANVTRRISASRELPTTPNPNALTEDSFFAGASSDSTSNSLSVAVPADSESTEYPASTADHGSLSSLKGRHWLLLLGGVIVVLLLFAPGRKKPLQANHA